MADNLHLINIKEQSNDDPDHPVRIDALIYDFVAHTDPVNVSFVTEVGWTGDGTTSEINTLTGGTIV